MGIHVPADRGLAGISDALNRERSPASGDSLGQRGPVFDAQPSYAPDVG